MSARDLSHSHYSSTQREHDVSRDCREIFKGSKSSSFTAQEDKRIVISRGSMDSRSCSPASANELAGKWRSAFSSLVELTHFQRL